MLKTIIYVFLKTNIKFNKAKTFLNKYLFIFQKMLFHKIKKIFSVFLFNFITFGVLFGFYIMMEILIKWYVARIKYNM